MDYLPDSWRFKDEKNPALETTSKLKISGTDQQWIGETLFVGKNKIKDDAESILWWRHPLSPKFSINQKPQPDTYVTHRLFLWMPVRNWKVVFKHPVCNIGTLV